MNPLFQHPILEPLGWTLLHFLWEGALLAILLVIGLTLLRSRPSHVRYTLACSTLGVLALCPVVTFYCLNRQTMTSFEGMSGITLSAHKVVPYLPLLVCGWIVGVVCLSLHLLCGWVGIYRLANTQVSHVPEWLEARFHQMAQNLRLVRPVTLLASGLAQTPMAFGLIKRVVLLPAGALMGLSPQALEAILAHELAHIRRHDYLINLLQTLLETVLFYHPAVWWVSRQVRDERENCCDDLAVALLGNKKLYAHALVSLEEWRGAVSQPALAASGGDLLYRIRRVLGVAAPQPVSTKAGVAGTSILLMGTLFLLLCLSAPKAKTAIVRRAAKAITLGDLLNANALPLDVPGLKVRTAPANPPSSVVRTTRKPKPAPAQKPAAVQTPKSVDIVCKPAPATKTAMVKAEEPTDLVNEIEDDHDPDNAWLKPLVQIVKQETLKKLAKESVQQQIDIGLKEAEKALKEAQREIQDAETKANVSMT